MTESQQKTCPRCGARFGCGAPNHQCWCNDLPALKTVEAESDCLCPDCLRLALSRQDHGLDTSEVKTQSGAAQDSVPQK